MATFKHISSKNADYGAAKAYLTFEHDEFTMKPTLDENGRLIPREDYQMCIRDSASDKKGMFYLLNGLKVFATAMTIFTITTNLSSICLLYTSAKDKAKQLNAARDKVKKMDRGREI